ncbi:tetratricopeptide repeat protein [Xanthomonas translucens]|uniref:Tetratricopeptide repeat protein n=2 Tax=Xanthomonas translucens pv. translucens TaxID=134875 RepID=A0ABW9KST2_XANCT|nr:tetratricopeptide repeat protein [Xanthomonas translucens]KTF40040.1 cytochrome C biogenesis protein [Xanthomonas translucens pv. translucens]MCC8448035.1 cytochrome C biogenesis protein [Xanthomonas translucens pv. translucens]MCS3360264.1 cytochrome C biogenesis protein [Xanthomonas translucens pv. translucens]MCS3373778.1 cytochrome C biogenesis protein [Xanthomonas translucens pv. translucens]MCT8274247.1 cytochrome C biogenesis protein [Xanthomonas translucens pv. translucens]
MVTAGFCITATLMVAIALSALLWPLLRRQLGARRWRLTTAALLAATLPLASTGLYLLVGDPAALAGVPVQATSGPAPDPTPAALQQWMDKALAATQAKRPAEARDAYAQALRIDPDNGEALLGWVEADMAQQPDFAVGATAHGMLERVLAQQPDNQRALWMLGIGEFQRQHYADAAAHWRHLRSLLPETSPLREAVAQKIAAAEAMAAAPTATPAATR